jgi:hypothetical protein
MKGMCMVVVLLFGCETGTSQALYDCEHVMRIRDSAMDQVAIRRLHGETWDGWRSADEIFPSIGERRRKDRELWQVGSFNNGSLVCVRSQAIGVMECIEDDYKTKIGLYCDL